MISQLVYSKKHLINCGVNHRSISRFARPGVGLVLAVGLLSTSFTATAAPALKLFTEGVTAPAGFVEVPGETPRFILVDQVGKAFVVSATGEKSDRPFLDLTGKVVELSEGWDERGLLGLALHPKFTENRKFYVYYSVPRVASTPEGWDSRSRISEFTAKADLGPTDVSTERVLLEYDQPWNNHNGGDMTFGPDGLLYIASGDGGNAHDLGRRYNEEIGNGQNTETLLGKILRIDVDKRTDGLAYGIPSDNPFADGGGRPEIFAYGLRNPWRLSFDMGGDHELFTADIGQTLWEEVNIIEKGGNYGWFIKEGLIDFDPKSPRKPKDGDTDKGFKGEPLIDPIIVYKNFNGFPGDPQTKGISITGGYVYRGTEFPDLVGKYIFADWATKSFPQGGTIYVGTPPEDGEGMWSMETLEVKGSNNGQIKGYITAFGQDSKGEIYVLTNDLNRPAGETGKVWKLVKE